MPSLVVAPTHGSHIIVIDQMAVYCIHRTDDVNFRVGSEAQMTV